MQATCIMPLDECQGYLDEKPHPVIRQDGVSRSENKNLRELNH